MTITINEYITDWVRLGYQEARLMFDQGIEVFILYEDYTIVAVTDIAFISTAIIDHDVITKKSSVNKS